MEKNTKKKEKVVEGKKVKNLKNPALFTDLAKIVKKGLKLEDFSTDLLKNWEMLTKEEKEEIALANGISIRTLYRYISDYQKEPLSERRENGKL